MQEPSRPFWGSPAARRSRAPVVLVAVLSALRAIATVVILDGFGSDVDRTARNRTVVSLALWVRALGVNQWLRERLQVQFLLKVERTRPSSSAVAAGLPVCPGLRVLSVASGRARADNVAHSRVLGTTRFGSRAVGFRGTLLGLFAWTK